MREGLILKPNMIHSGLRCATQESVDEVAAVTVKCFLQVLTAVVSGIAFLSGGQSPELGTGCPNAMNVLAGLPGSRVPWPLAFLFARADVRSFFLCLFIPLKI